MLLLGAFETVAFPAVFNGAAASDFSGVVAAIYLPPTLYGAETLLLDWVLVFVTLVYAIFT